MVYVLEDHDAAQPLRPAGWLPARAAPIVRFMQPTPPAPAHEASGPLALLTAMNILNYIDRYVITAMLPSIQRDLQLDDRQGGMLGTAFIVVYFLASPGFGWLGDRGHRPRWLAAGVAVWSLATASAGLAKSVAALFVARASVGIGEAAYGTIAPALLADHFPKALRGRIMSYFYLATPVGAALGYLLGGALGAAYGWRHTFFVVGLPGLALAVAAWFMQDPPRGRFDAGHAGAALKARETWQLLLANRLYLGTVAGYVAYTFALGGLAYWMPSYMIRERGYPQAHGMLVFGGITVITGIVGTLAGGWLADALLKHTPKAYTWVNSLSMLGAAAGAWLTLHMHDKTLFVICLVASQVCTFLSIGPVNALIVNSVPAHVRATAMAMSMLAIHLLGDAISPTLIGTISDRSSLTHGMTAIPVFFLLAGALWATTLPKRRRA